MLFLSILAFLVPIATYCWLLALVNRRAKATVVSGLWDGAGMLFGAAGILLVVFPFLIYFFFLRKYLNTFTPEAENDVLYWWRITWSFYFTLLVFGVARMLWGRRNKTVFYNVDTDLFGHLLHDALDALGMRYTRVANRLIIWEKIQEQHPAEIPHACAELVVEVFPPMCNVSLHWVHGESKWRTIVEKRLAQGLEGTRTFDNPANSWFMGLSGVLFGLIFLTILVWILINYFPPRHL